MNKLLLIFLIILSTFNISCKNQNNLPQNNNFSYLDSAKVLNSAQNTENPTIAPKENRDLINCPKIHRELLGNIFQKSIKDKSSNDYKNYIVLTLNTPLLLDCNQNQHLKVEQVELTLSPDFNIDQYLGSSVIVIGEISSNNDAVFPIKMDVLRIEPIKGAIQ
jgi:hypothetical protein